MSSLSGSAVRAFSPSSLDRAALGRPVFQPLLDHHAGGGGGDLQLHVSIGPFCPHRTREAERRVP